jgi:putative membrane protein
MPFGYHHHGFGVGFGPGRPIFMVLFLVLIVLAIAWAISTFSHRRDHAHHWPITRLPAPNNRTNVEAERILEERFARGEIDADEFKERRDLLREHS